MQCKFIKKDGARCQGTILFEDGFCIHHSKSERAKKAKERPKTSPGKTSFTRRIIMKCFDCAGSPKEITLCHLFDCPLWAIRFGYPQRNKNYAKRMKRAETRYIEDFKELKRQGIDVADFYKDHPVYVVPKNG